ncbi:MAG: hypothetical protein PHT07_04250 [Paludibacter sp.]|nr:hypothetical protein [Paludibacter sp.]
MPIDFTLKAYRQLLIALKQSDYSFYTFEDWCDKKAQGRYVLLRHDVDLKAANSLAIARIEAELDIRSTFYFRIVPQSNQPEIIRSIANLGHEIGYHYEDLSIFKGDTGKAIEHFISKLDYFRQYYPVRTICMHGSPTSKWDNRDLWKTYNYKDFGLIGEPYFDLLNHKQDQYPESNLRYFTDTARMWDGLKYNIRDKFTRKQDSNDIIDGSLLPALLSLHSTFNFIDWLKTKPDQNTLMITTHPQRWTDNYSEWLIELFMQKLKNSIKKHIVKMSSISD